VTQGYAAQLAVGPNGRWVAADEHTLHVWAGTTLERTVDLATMLGGPPRFGTDESVLAGRVEVDLKTGASTERIALRAVLDCYDPQGNPEQLAVRSVAWANDGRHALVFAEYLPTRLHGGTDTVRPGALLAMAQADDPKLRELDRGRFLDAGRLSGDRWLVSGGRRLLAFEPGRQTPVLDLDPDDAVSGIATRDDIIAAGLSGGEVLIVAVNTADDVQRWPGHDAVIDAVAVSSDGRLVATGDRDGHLLVRAVDTAGAVLGTDLAGSIEGVCFLAPDHLVVAVDGDDTELRHIELNG
jgi:hypothetical protein